VLAEEVDVGPATSLCLLPQKSPNTDAQIPKNLVTAIHMEQHAHESAETSPQREGYSSEELIRRTAMGFSL
jgi:hypothetical protein